MAFKDACRVVMATRGNDTSFDKQACAPHTHKIVVSFKCVLCIDKPAYKMHLWGREGFARGVLSIVMCVN